LSDAWSDGIEGWDLGRYEMKYAVREDRAAELVHACRAFVRPDEHATELPGGARGYIVTSVYFDTPWLEDYGSRLEEHRVRRRVRVRTYGAAGERQPVFLELKRKRDDLVLKQRALVVDADTWATLGERPWENLPPVRDSHAAQRFARVVRARALTPVVSVRYSREVWVDPERPRVRLTVDRDLLGSRLSSACDLYHLPEPVRLFPPGYVVLELKYDQVAPGWVRAAVRDLGLRAEPISKFALAVAQTIRADHPREARRLLPASLLHATRAAA
jgi:hypothetical protein